MGKKLRYSIILLILLFGFQNCRFEQTQLSSKSPITQTNLDGSGTGDTYDGKPTPGRYVHETTQLYCGGEYSPYQQNELKVDQDYHITLNSKTIYECSQSTQNISLSDVEYFNQIKGFVVHKGHIFKHESLIKKDWVTELWCRSQNEKQNIFVEYSPVLNQAQIFLNHSDVLTANRKLNGKELIINGTWGELKADLETELFFGSGKYAAHFKDVNNNINEDFYCYAGANTLPKTTFKKIRSFQTTFDSVEYEKVYRLGSESGFQLDAKQIRGQGLLSKSRKFLLAVEPQDERTQKIEVYNLINGHTIQHDIQIESSWVAINSFWNDEDTELVLQFYNYKETKMSIKGLSNRLIPVILMHYKIDGDQLQLINKIESTALEMARSVMQTTPFKIDYFLEDQTSQLITQDRDGIKWVSHNTQFESFNFMNYSLTTHQITEKDLPFTEVDPLFGKTTEAEAQYILQMETPSQTLNEVGSITVQRYHHPGILWGVTKTVRSPAAVKRSMKHFYQSRTGKNLVDFGSWKRIKTNYSSIRFKDKILIFQLDEPEEAVQNFYISQLDTTSGSIQTVELPELQSHKITKIYPSPQNSNRLYFEVADHLFRYQLLELDIDHLKIISNISIPFSREKSFLWWKKAYFSVTRQYHTSAMPYLLNYMSLNDQIEYTDLTKDIPTKNTNGYYDMKIINSYENNQSYLLKFDHMVPYPYAKLDSISLYTIDFEQGPPKFSFVSADIDDYRVLTKGKLFLLRRVGKEYKYQFSLFDLNNQKEAFLTDNLKLEENEIPVDLYLVKNTNICIILTGNVYTGQAYWYAMSLH